MRELSGLFLLLVSLYSTLSVFSLMKRGRFSGYVYVIFIVLIFFVSHSILDTFGQIAFLDYYPEIIKTLEDDTVAIVYDIYISLFLILLVKGAKKNINNGKKIIFDNIARETGMRLYILFKKYNFIFWFIFIFPLLVTLLIGDYGYYSSYLERYFIEERPKSHTIIDKLVLIGVLLGGFMAVSVLYKKRMNPRSVVLPTMLFIFLVEGVYFWIYGKRSIVVLFFVLYIVLLSITKAVSIKKLLKYVFAILILLISFMNFYGKGVKENLEETYVTMRVDFGRDYGLKYAIHNDLILDRNIVPYKMASFIFIGTFFIPREIWAEKPHPYAVYFTNSAFGNFGESHMYGWGLTTSILSEAISNLGFLGLFIGPYIILYILKREVRSSSPFFKLFSILVAILLLLLEIIAFMPLFVLYLWMLLKEKKS
ncbi:hypothetical protein [Capnocytophaga canis]|uniref:hypothetical protein n=1 Tax=Capnocytophaga canis TaxID=1848903 RepID=UPI001562DD6B|nr:hypothetical protein [Capnocytophaga canis]